MLRRKTSIVLMIALGHMAIVFTFLYLGVSLAGFESSNDLYSSVGNVLFVLSIIMMFPVALLRYLHFPTLSSIPLWDGSLGDYFGGLVDLPLLFLNSVIWAMVIYHVWHLFRRAKT